MTKTQSETRKMARTYRRNMQVISKYAPNLERQLEELFEQQSQPSDIEAVPARSGQPTLRLRLNSGQVHLHSTYDPGAEAEQWVNHVAEEDWQIGVIYGLGLSYHVEELGRHCPDRQLVVVESDPKILQTLLYTRDIRAMLRNPNLHLLVNVTARNAASQVFATIKKHLTKGSLAFLTWPPYRRIWPAFWDELQAYLGELSQQDRVNIATNRNFSLTWPKNLFRNVRRSIGDPSVTELYTPFKGKPAILVAAGPSLEKNVHLLAEAKDRALIVAAGSAIGALDKHGIEPDFIVSFDAGVPNYFHFAKLDTQQRVLIYSAVVQPRLLAEYDGPRFAMGVDSYPHERWINHLLGLDRGMVASGPSVANLTWDLLRQMGCDPIIFVGQDLALTGDKTHASGVMQAEEWTARDQQIAQLARQQYEFIEDIEGNQVRTTKPLLAMKVWFEQRIEHWRNQATYIDATEGGARIAGTEIMTLRQVIDQYCGEPFYPYRRLMQVYEGKRSQTNFTERQKQLTEILADLDGELAEIEQLCEQGVQALNELATLQEANLSPRVFDRVASEVSRTDVALGKIDTYNYLLRPSLSHNRVAFATLSTLLKEETDLAVKNERLVALYGGLFDKVMTVLSEVRSYVNTAMESESAYEPVSLQHELNQIVQTASEMKELAVELSRDGSQRTITPEQYRYLLGQLQEYDDSLNESEIYREYVHRWIRSGHSQIAYNIDHLATRLSQANEETDLARKATLLADLYGTLCQSIGEAIGVVCDLTGSTVEISALEPVTVPSSSPQPS